MSAKERILILFGADSALEWGRSFQLAKAFTALGHEVLYIDLPTSIGSSFAGNGMPVTASDAGPFPVFRPRHGLPYGRLPWLRPINRKMILGQIKRIVAQKRFRPKWKNAAFFEK